MAFNLPVEQDCADMTSVQERLQFKRDPIDRWSLREQLCLASAVTRSGDQNWISVSRALKPFGETNRPSDWFHQKNCAAQYAVLLEKVESSKGTKKSGMEGAVETSAELILKNLLADRLLEIKKLLAEEKAEHKRLQDDMKALQTGKVSEEQLGKWCKEIEEEESKREQKASNHARWLKQRDSRKQEIERIWRPLQTSFPVVGQKRKLSDISGSSVDNGQSQHRQHYLTPSEQCHQKSMQYTQPMISVLGVQAQSQHQTIHIQSQESVKPALSPLLTSLLKSPSQVQTLSPLPTSILHNVITSQGNNSPVSSGDISSPTITSLLNASTGTSAVSSDKPNFSTCAINEAINQGQNNLSNDDPSQPLDADILDDANIKIDDLAKSILVEDGPFPEIKKEEVDDIISEIIENAHDIVADPEHHLQLDENGDININLELNDLEQDSHNKKEECPKTECIAETKSEAKSPLPIPIIDPFEFQEDPVLFDSPVKPSSLKQDNTQYTPLYQHSPVKCDDVNKKNIENIEPTSLPADHYGTNHVVNNRITKHAHGSVEIVEVVTEVHENEKEFNKAQICDIVHSDREKEDKGDTEGDTESQVLPQAKTSEADEYQFQVITHIPENEPELKNAPTYFEEKINPNSDINFSSFTSQTDEAVLDYADDLYDNVNMEVKIDKTGKAKRDYSRTKKKEEKGFDMLLAIEKAQIDDMSMPYDVVEYKAEGQKRGVSSRTKQENERSSSPEEEDGKGNKKRTATPEGTPVDSLPNSPASSIAFDDDKDHRNWKKSVMLVYNRLASNKYASLFLKPITDDQAPGYSTVVYRPMDLQTVKKNIDNGVIRTSLEFKRDVMLMFTNAVMYNKTNGTVYNMALQIQQESMDPIEILLQAQGQVEVPMRRETRTSESNCKRKRVSDDCVKNKKKKDE